MSDERCRNCGCRIHAADYRIGVCDCDCQSHTIAALRVEVERLTTIITGLKPPVDTTCRTCGNNHNFSSDEHCVVCGDYESNHDSYSHTICRTSYAWCHIHALRELLAKGNNR